MGSKQQNKETGKHSEVDAIITMMIREGLLEEVTFA